MIYGLPDITAMDLAAEGKLILGGCMLGSDDPDWLCLPCAKGPDPQTD
ncbi:hypothetical protein O2W15_20630 [Modestobacter sp. VKM Ac-2979]|nr:MULTISPECIES: hypothetical protein [Modestobacter]MCZ2813845.1 hypothetical protein [Modestobacter sp. VKM Ac-2979]MCZ2844180.1 hypothetical protein [Modestobacter sp. VKM Ac-2980]